METTGHGLPMRIGRLLIVEVNHIDLIELTPDDTLTIQMGDTVGREVGHLDTQLIGTFPEGVATVEYKGYGPCTADKLSI